MDVSLISNGKIFKCPALVDTGAQCHAVIDSNIAQLICHESKTDQTLLLSPKSTRTYQGKRGDPITHQICLTMSIGCSSGKQMTMDVPMLVTQLGQHAVILGKGWIRQNRAIIDLNSPKPLTFQPTINSNPHERIPLSVAERSELCIAEKTDTETAKNAPMDMAMIGAAPFYLLAKKNENSIAAISLGDFDKFMNKERQDLGNQMNLKELLPEVYHEFAHVFSKEISDTLPPLRRGFDHEIHLKEGSNPQRDVGHAFLRSMSEEELVATRKYLEENLTKGFIEVSKSAVSSPVLFAKKPSGGLRFCVDYRKLNAITEKDSYPIPLIQETMSLLRGVKWFTKLDVQQAFHRLRMRLSDENLTTFLTRFGAYKYKVMPFGLCGGPSSFQRFINETLWEFLNDFVTAYLDDVLIYGRGTLREHQKDVKKVLERLGEAGLQVDISKCEFSVKRTKFLGLIVTTEGIEMDPEKVKAVKEWPMPRKLKDLQSFLGFCNFYRRFIKDYSRITKCLTELTKKDTIFDMTDISRVQAFNLLKEKISQAPILRHFDPNKACLVETDSSDYVNAGVLSQEHDGISHPVAFFSKKMVPAECNYEIYDKELLAIIRAFEHWRPELEGTALPIKVLTDHKALEYFMSTKTLTRRQVRWAEILSRYNFVISYKPGRENGKADALTRISTDAPGKEDDRTRYMKQILIPAERLLPLHIATLEDETQPPSLDTLWEEGRSKDLVYCQLKSDIQSGKRKTKTHRISLSECEAREGEIFYRNRIWVPGHCDLQLRLIQQRHDTPSAGHPGYERTFSLLKDYYWPGMTETIKRYVKNCTTCSRTKASRELPSGLLKPLQIPDGRWKDISVDFVTGLPEGPTGNNAIMTVVDRFSKRKHFIACRATDAGTGTEAMVSLFLEHVWKLHGLPESIISDRGSQFVSDLWESLCRKLGVERRLSTAYHPQTDGQSESANAQIEQYLRCFTTYLQDDWEKWLPMGEFSINNTNSTSLGCSPFMADTGRKPRMDFDVTPNDRSTTREQITEDWAQNFVQRMKDAEEDIRDQLQVAQAEQEKQANRGRRPAPDYHPGDLVFLSSKNLKVQRPTRKLGPRYEGPFPIDGKVGSHAYRLRLPKAMKIHPVFHVSLLKPAWDDHLPPLPGQQIDPPQPVIIDEEEEWLVDEILDSRMYRKRLQYRVKWSDSPDDRTWYNADSNEFEHCDELVQRFHERYPEKPKP